MGRRASSTKPGRTPPNFGTANGSSAKSRPAAAMRMPPGRFSVSWNGGPNWLRAKSFHGKGTDDNKRPLFTVPKGLVRILDRDLQAAGIDRRDERGRSIDVHALRHSFGTLLSKGGVAPRTAHAAMRHSTIDLTMNTYTDPKLLDVHGALDSLPSLNLNPSDSTVRNAMRATGTDHQAANPRHVRSAGTSDDSPLVPNSGKPGQSVSFAVISAGNNDEQASRTASGKNPMISSEKASPAVFASKASGIGMTGFEPAASTSRT